MAKTRTRREWVGGAVNAGLGAGAFVSLLGLIGWAALNGVGKIGLFGVHHGYRVQSIGLVGASVFGVVTVFALAVLRPRDVHDIASGPDAGGPARRPNVWLGAEPAGAGDDRGPDRPEAVNR